MARQVEGEVAHVRIAVADLGRAARFYGALFGWIVEEPSGTELSFRAPGGFGGVFWSAGEPSTAGPELYIRVACLEVALGRALELGAARLVRPGPGPAGGRSAQVLDPEGNRVCLWEPPAATGNRDPP